MAMLESTPFILTKGLQEKIGKNFTGVLGNPPFHMNSEADLS